MAGLEPARAFYGPTDFKSVASTIPPHRRRIGWILSWFLSGENEYRSVLFTNVVNLPESLALALLVFGKSSRRP